MKRDFPEIWKAVKKGWSAHLVKVKTSGNRVSEFLDATKLGEVIGD
jgi:hypothetical protein